eukprot:UN11855
MLYCTDFFGTLARIFYYFSHTKCNNDLSKVVLEALKDSSSGDGNICQMFRDSLASESKVKFSRDAIRNELMGLFIAGHETNCQYDSLDFILTGL